MAIKKAFKLRLNDDIIKININIEGKIQTIKYNIININENLTLTNTITNINNPIIAS